MWQKRNDGLEQLAKIDCSERVETMKENFIQKRYLKIFDGNNLEQVIQKIDAFSKRNPVQILNYEILSVPASGETKILIFYSQFEE